MLSMQETVPAVAAGVAARVAGLWQYPVQSLRGQPLDQATFTTTGLLGDRGYAIADVGTGVMVGSSRPGWIDLVTWTARYLGPVTADAPLPPVEIIFPDGNTLRSDDPACDEILSSRLGKAVRLALNDNSVAQRRYELAPCHFVTTATLKALRNGYPGGDFDPARFRPNILLDCGETSGFVEQDWLGRDLACGDVTFRVSEDCVRCAMTVRAQGNLPKDPRILHTVTQMNRTFAGSYATVSRPGSVRLGDSAALAG